MGIWRVSFRSAVLEHSTTTKKGERGGEGWWSPMRTVFHQSFPLQSLNQIKWPSDVHLNQDHKVHAALTPERERNSQTFQEDKKKKAKTQQQLPSAALRASPTLSWMESNRGQILHQHHLPLPCSSKEKFTWLQYVAWWSFRALCFNSAVSHSWTQLFFTWVWHTGPSSIQSRHADW